MSDTFPKWTNHLPRNLIIGAVLVGTGVVLGSNYYFTPKYSRVGYEPAQPVQFSHNIHAGQLGMDCRYCHNGVEKSLYSNIPATSTCMNCHNQVLKDDPRLAPVRESAATGMPIKWVQIHKLPDYAYFNHSVHVNRGVSCVECHGRVDKMDEVYHAQPFSMSFCLECHRDPQAKVRPLDKITDLGWNPANSNDPKKIAEERRKIGTDKVEHWKVQSLQNCSTCHR
jgi:formate-dependent nitrite reductase cytochrome c552 subunit